MQEWIKFLSLNRFLPIRCGVREIAVSSRLVLQRIKDEQQDRIKRRQNRQRFLSSCKSYIREKLPPLMDLLISRERSPVSSRKYLSGGNWTFINLHNYSTARVKVSLVVENLSLSIYSRLFGIIISRAQLWRFSLRLSFDSSSSLGYLNLIFLQSSYGRDSLVPRLWSWSWKVKCSRAASTQRDDRVSQTQRAAFSSLPLSLRYVSLSPSPCSSLPRVFIGRSNFCIDRTYYSLTVLQFWSTLQMIASRFPSNNYLNAPFSLPCKESNAKVTDKSDDVISRTSEQVRFTYRIPSSCLPSRIYTETFRASGNKWTAHCHIYIFML